MIQTQAQLEDLAGNKPTQAKLSAYQMDELRSQFENISFKLEQARQHAQKKQSQLAEVCDKEAKAERLLFLTKDSTGFAQQRERAQEVLEICRRRRAELSPMVESLNEAVKRLEEDRGRIDTRQFAPVKEIEDLARELRTPLAG